MLSIQTILVPTDFSETDDQALQVALSLGRDHHAKLVLFAAPPPPPPASEVYVPLHDYDGVTDATERQLSELARTITALPVETKVRIGPPGPAIVAVAEECQADLIVMGTHGRRGLSRILLGSVAEYVLRHAPCPVLTIKPKTAAHLQHELETSLSVPEPIAGSI